MGKCKEYETAKNAQGTRKYIGNLYFAKKEFFLCDRNILTRNLSLFYEI